MGLIQPGPYDNVGLGTALFTLVEPHQGEEVAYNRWYERDHFYAGCMIGKGWFAGRRWVATRELKDLRFPADTDFLPDIDAGSYLATYWVEKGEDGPAIAWGSEQVKWLHENDRMYEGRDHIHTLMYVHRWAYGRDDDGVPPALALDHPFQGLAAVMVDRTEDSSLDKRAFSATLRDEILPAAVAGTPIALTIALTPIPLPEGAPVFQPDNPGVGAAHPAAVLPRRRPPRGVARRPGPRRCGGGRRRGHRQLRVAVPPHHHRHRHLHRPALVAAPGSGRSRAVSPARARIAPGRPTQFGERRGADGRRDTRSEGAATAAGLGFAGRPVRSHRTEPRPLPRPGSCNPTRRLQLPDGLLEPRRAPAPVTHARCPTGSWNPAGQLQPTDAARQLPDEVVKPRRAAGTSADGWNARGRARRARGVRWGTPDRREGGRTAPRADAGVASAPATESSGSAEGAPPTRGSKTAARPRKTKTKTSVSRRSGRR